MIALIPARAGSKRCPGKNTRFLAGHQLIAYTIAAAQESGVFDRICIATDDPLVKAVMPWDGKTFFYTREPVPDDQPDIEWVKEALKRYPDQSFAILRPTSPFRTADTIRRAHAQFARAEVHSIRAVEPVKQHPYKMWTWAGAGYPIKPLFDEVHWLTPKHSMPTQTLPKIYVQNASLEMAWTYVIPAFGTISGTKIAPFFTEGYEGFDVNDEDDWREAERLVRDGLVTLPSLRTWPPLSAPQAP